MFSLTGGTRIKFMFTYWIPLYYLNPFSFQHYEFSSSCYKTESSMQCYVSVKYSLEVQRFIFGVIKPQNLIKPNCCISFLPRANSRWLNFLATLPYGSHLWVYLLSLSHAVRHGEQQQQLPLLPYNTSTIQSTTFWRTAIYLIFYLTFNDGFHYAQSGIPQHKTLLISLPRLAFYMICLNVTWS